MTGSDAVLLLFGAMVWLARKLADQALSIMVACLGRFLVRKGGKLKSRLPVMMSARARDVLVSERDKARDERDEAREALRLLEVTRRELEEKYDALSERVSKRHGKWLN